MFRKCCCSDVSSCSDTCSCSTDLKQIYIQAGIDVGLCYFQQGNQETRSPVTCNSDVGGFVANEQFYTVYPQSLYGCRWGRTYSISRVEDQSYYCPGGCSECEEDCCWNNPNAGPCYPLAGDCDLPDCDCDSACCALLYPSPEQAAERANCNLACIDQQWQRFCSSGAWETNIVGSGLKKSFIEQPPNMEWGTAVKRNSTPVTYGGFTIYGASDSEIIPGSDEMVDGSLLTWGNFTCPSGKTCTSWSLSGNCGGSSGISDPWYGYAKKTGKHYLLLNGNMKVEAKATLLAAPQGGNEECYDTQFSPNVQYHTWNFQVLFEGTSSGTQINFEQVNSVAGPSSSTQLPALQSDGNCKCPGYVEGQDQQLFWKIGAAYASGFSI